MDDSNGDDVATHSVAVADLVGQVPVAFDLRVVSGPDRGVSRRIGVDDVGPCNVGTSELSWLRLTDRSVSRRHIALTLTDSGLHLKDLGSTNGTRVHGVRVVEALLSGGELVQLGDTTLQVSEVLGERAPGFPARQLAGIVGQSPQMQRLYPVCERIAQSDVPVVIEGETGTGKELLAEAIHQLSARAERPFVVFDCTTVSAALMEAALFGHERGAFTGAQGARQGVFEEANGGTLLIDEIGELDVELQPKLLRAIERGEVRRVGGERWQCVDVRVMAATRRDLEREIQAGRFRDDLFYRLAVARIELPPLRERRGDVALLAAHFWQLLGGPEPLSPAFLAQLEERDFPGNVRELRNLIARRIALGDLEEHVAGMSASEKPLPSDADVITEVIDLGLPLGTSRDLVLQEFERRYVETLLARHENNTTRAAEAAGVARRYFQILKAKRTAKK